MKNLIWMAILIAFGLWLFWPHSSELDPGVKPRCQQELPRSCPNPYYPPNGAVNP